MEPVSLAVGTVALFKNCIEIFEYIQLARRHGREFELCQIKLDVARVRLSRWGKAVGIHEDPPFAVIIGGTEDQKLISTTKAVLSQIKLLFEEMEDTTRRYDGASDSRDSSTLIEGETSSPLAQNLHNRLKEIAKKRQKQTSLLRKTSWALHDSKRSYELVERITGFVDDLHELLPSQVSRENMLALAKGELEEINDEPMLQLLQDAATDVDSILLEAVEQKVEDMASRNTGTNIDMEENARIRVGNEWAEVFATSGDRGVRSPENNLLENVRAKGATRIHVGNSYGGKSIFDD